MFPLGIWKLFLLLLAVSVMDACFKLTLEGFQSQFFTMYVLFLSTIDIFYWCFEMFSEIFCFRFQRKASLRAFAFVSFFMPIILPLTGRPLVALHRSRDGSATSRSILENWLNWTSAYNSHLVASTPHPSRVCHHTHISQ